MSWRQRVGLSYGETQRRHHAWEMASQSAQDVEDKYGADSIQAKRAWAISKRAKKEFTKVRGRG